MMNQNTGELKYFDENKSGELVSPWAPADMSLATAKQKKQMKVRLHDHRSKLGKVLTKRRYRSLRKKKVLR